MLYETLSSLGAFRSACASRPFWVIQPKYDGWYSRIDESGVHIRTGVLVSPICAAPGVVYEAEWLRGTTWANAHAERGRYIVHWCNRGYGYHLPAGLPGRWVEQWPTSNVERVIQDVLPQYEGLVLKNPDSGFFYRYKKQTTVDYVVTGINRHTRNASLKIALWRDTSLVRVGSVALNLYILSLEKRPVVGRVIEVSGASFYPSGALRHPVFIRFRDDKPTKECTFEQSTPA